jgi:hypothetical protein
MSVVRRLCVVVFILVLNLVFVLPVGSRVSAPMLRVSFLQGEQMDSVERPGSTAVDAVSALLAGPTSLSRARGCVATFRRPRG